MKRLRFRMNITAETIEEIQAQREAHLQEWTDTIVNHVPFRAGNMKGIAGVSALPCMIVDGPSSGTTAHGLVGELPEPHRTQFRRSYLDYVIYSYDTPIAWCGSRACDGCPERNGYHDHLSEWHVPAVNYSLTTTQHQFEVTGSLRRAGVEWTTGEHVNTRKGKGLSPFGPRAGW